MTIFPGVHEKHCGFGDRQEMIVDGNRTMR